MVYFEIFHITSYLFHIAGNEFTDLDAPFLTKEIEVVIYIHFMNLKGIILEHRKNFTSIQ